MISNIIIIILWVLIAIVSSINPYYHIGAIITIWLATITIIMNQMEIRGLK